MAPKVFPKDGWEKTEFVPTKFRGFLELIRPFTLFAPLIGGLSGAFLALAWAGDITWELDYMKLIWGVMTLVFMNAASNTLNQITDLEIDKINKPYRPLPSRVVTVKEAKVIAVVLYLVTMWRAALVNLNFFILVMALITITVLYSVEPVRLKKWLFVNNISIALARGMLGFVAAWCIFGEITDPVPWIIGSVMAVYLIGGMTAKDFTDAEGDAKYGCKTLPVVFGNKMAIYMSIPFFIIPFLIIPVAVWFGYLPEVALILAIIYLVGGGVLAVMMFKEANIEDPKFENSPVWKMMYFMLMAIQLGFGIIFFFKDVSFNLSLP